MPARAGEGASRPAAAATTCVVAFDALPEPLLVRLRPASTLVIAEARPSRDFAWRRLAEVLGPASLDDALALLERLNALCDASGRPYRSAVRHHEYEPWWFHQQTALDEYLVPFLRYRPLLEACSAAQRLILADCPPDLRRLLPLLGPHARVELLDRATRPQRLRRLRRIASGVLYRVETLRALVPALVRRPDCLVYVVDALDADGRSRWIDGLYRALDARRTRYLEVVWSESGARALRQRRLRRRPVVFWQAVAAGVRRPAAGNSDAVAAPPDDPTGRFLHALANRVLLPASRGSVRTIRRWERLLRLLRPGGVYLMDDYVHAFDLVVACKRRGIPTVALQHGQISRYTAGLMGYGFDGRADHAFDRYCVWGEFFAQLIGRHSRLVRPESVVVAGSPRARGATHSAAGGPARAAGSPVLFLTEHYDAVMQQSEVAPYVQALADAGFDVWIKPHPSVARVPVPARAAAGGREPRVVTAPLEELLDRAGVVVASFSSAIFEAILHETPVVLFSTSRYDDPHGLARAGLAELAASPGEIAERVRAAAALPAQELERRRETVWGARPGDAGEVAVREMERLRASGSPVG